MAGLERRLVEAEASLTTLDEAVGRTPRSLMDRDSAILRLIYTLELVWKACQQLLADRPDSALEPGDLYRLLYADPRLVYRVARGEIARLSARSRLVQRQRRALRGFRR